MVVWLRNILWHSLQTPTRHCWAMLGLLGFILTSSLMNSSIQQHLILSGRWTRALTWQLHWNRPQLNIQWTAHHGTFANDPSSSSFRCPVINQQHRERTQWNRPCCLSTFGLGHVKSRSTLVHRCFTTPPGRAPSAQCSESGSIPARFWRVSSCQTPHQKPGSSGEFIFC